MSSVPTPSLRKLPFRYNAVVMPMVLSIIMSCIVSGISTLTSIGPSTHFVASWMQAWLVSWIVAFPSLLLALPVTRRIVSVIVEQG